jgi:serine/threonine protein kinase
MSYLHERNVCHGDLKLENVLLRTGGGCGCVWARVVERPSMPG